MPSIHLSRRRLLGCARSASFAGALLLLPVLPARAQFFRAAPRAFHPAPYGAGGEAALADFNGDGKLDGARPLLDLTLGLVVQLGDGAGNFGAPRITPVGGSVFSNSRAIVVADFNVDGKLDVATCHLASGAYVFLGIGDGTFIATGLGGASTALFAEGMAAGDFDGDGKLDLAMVRRTQLFSITIALFRGQGNGLFDPAISVPVPTVLSPKELAAADFDRDGKTDLVVADEAGNRVVVLMGNAGLTFPARGPFAAGEGALGVRSADLNGDLNPDVVVANRTAGTLSVLLGNGTGDLGPASTIPAPRAAEKLDLADFDGDGRVDVAVSGSGTSVYLGNGAGGLGPPTRYGVRGDLASGDLTGDGKRDLVVLMNVLLNEGNGQFIAQRAFPAGRQPEGMAGGDWNHDGKLDLAVANPPASVVSILLGDGAGGFGAPSSVVTFSDPYRMTTGDFNADGHADLAVITQTSSEVVILNGNGAGAFTPGPRYFVGTTPTGIATGDWNGDGRVDLAVSCQYASSVSILTGTGAGTFVLGTPAAVGLGGLGLAAGRLNEDVRDDLVVIRNEYPQVPNPVADTRLLAGTGAATFIAPAVLPAAIGGVTILATDLDQDGYTDIAVGGGGQQQFPLPQGGIGLTFGGPGGAFEFHSIFGPEGVRSLAPADFTRDGRPDLAVTHGSAGTLAGDGSLSVAVGGPGPTFAATASFDVGGRAPESVVGDFNGDGFPDVVAGNGSGDSVTVFLNQPASPGADLAVAVTDSADPAFGTQPVRYTATVTNNGPLPARSVLFTFTTPAGLTWVGVDPGAPACVTEDISGGFGTVMTTCAIDTLAPGASFALNTDTTVYQGAGHVTTRARASLLSPLDPNPLNDTWLEETRINPLDLSLSLAASPDPVASGGTLHVSYVVENHGPAVGHRVFTFLPPLPGLVPASASSNCQIFPDNSVTCGANEVPPGTTTTGFVDYTAGQFTIMTITARTESDETGFLGSVDLNPEDNTASVEVHVSPLVGKEITHGTVVTRVIPSPGAEDRYQIRESAPSSYEVLVDAASGDLSGPGGAVALERLGADATAVVQTSQPVGTGPGRSLRWEYTATAPTVEAIRVRSTGCGSGCGSDDTFRLRAYETTASIARFNNAGTQSTVVLLFNPRDQAVSGHLWAWSQTGAPLASQAFSVAARRSLVLNLAFLTPGTQGSLTITHDAPYGGLVGKSVALEPATGYSFDTPLVWKGR